MTRGRRGPAPARGIGPQEAPAKKPQRRHSADDDRQPTGGELLRQLARHVRKGTDPADAREWQRVAAEVATPVVNGGRLDRTAAVTVLSLAAQAAGVGQANAFGVIWRACGCPVSGASRQLRYEWQREVRRYRLGHTTKSVAQYLALYADNDGRNAYPGVSRLAAECEMHERTVRKALQELKRVGLIELVTQGSAAGRQAQATVYNLTLPGDLAERLELVTVQPSKPAGSRRPRTGTPGPEPGDPEENTGSTARCSDPEHRILDPEHGVLSTGTPGPEYRNTGSRTRPHMPHMERDTPDGEERTGADRATVRPDDAATPCVPDTRPVPSDDQTPTAPVCTTRGHKGCGWLSTRNCLDCLSAEETRARLAELDDGDAA